ncbi:MAG: Gfo/Idh/MocA family oxidoreductase [candidate division WS1 bacterium]|jgi:predicted dehydrogenase|nr:Gfo/Idh/MocA family oxidoreductase [candidate division WS1 bacterium]
MASLSVAYIGAGGFSSRFIHPQLGRHEVELAAICDLDETRAQRAAACHGFARVYTDFHAMLDDERPDAVFCVGPHGMQYEVGLQVLRAGFPLYVQKPASNSSARVREMADAAAEASVVCHVGFNFRSAPSVRRVREIIAGGDFGAPSLGIIRYGLMSREVWREAILDQHVHAIDLLLHLLGDWKSAQVTPILSEGTRGYVAAVTLQSGCVASLNTVREMDAPDEFIYFEVTGRNGHTIFAHDGDLRYHRPGGDDICLRAGTWNPQRLIDWWGYFDDVASFLAAVRGEAEDICPIADTLRTMELAEEIVRLCHEGGAPQ